jgi:hypothetical protein
MSEELNIRNGSIAATIAKVRKWWKADITL